MKPTKFDSKQYQEFSVAEIRKLTHNTKLIVFNGDLSQSMLPGKHFMIRSKEGVARPYSPTICDNTAFHVAVKRYDGGKVSNFIHGLQHGDTVSIRGPIGSFNVEGIAKGPWLFIAGGSGITPIFSIIRNQIVSGNSQKMYLALCNSTRGDIMLESELADLAAQSKGNLIVDHIISAQHGRINHEKLQTIIDRFANPSFVGICGPSSFNTSVIELVGEICSNVTTSPNRNPTFWKF
eukprot:TRINITY_DN10838_c0_g1_i1.p1 TRINITY_DN10838_c0_g1~~TRINITY_DN10838_c0_g1_i1.p1  ORF type:complete len:236 (+),score=13.48 TRINITY_DN10838_c0_g1_i1:132-839(+)